MSGGWRIARIFGIDISIHPSWILIFVFMAFSIGSSYSTFGWSPATHWTVAVVVALLLFVSVLVHELAHSLVARAQGIPVRGITLFLLGGVSTIESEATSPGREVVMAGVGPLASVVIGGLCLLAAVPLRFETVSGFMLSYLGYINVVLGIFNLLPAFPLDGGRVLRSVLWAVTRDFTKATRWAARTGTVFGYLLVAFGVISAFGGLATLGLGTGLAGGLWTAFVGWILLQASRAAYGQSQTETLLAGVPVRRVMTQPPTWIPGDITLRKAADDYFLALDARCLPVQDDHGRLEGLVCVSDLQGADPRSWGVEQVQDVMTAADKLQTVAPDDPASLAFHQLTASGAGRLAVIDDGRFVGFVDGASVLRYLHTGRHLPQRPAPADGPVT